MKSEWIDDQPDRTAARDAAPGYGLEEVVRLDENLIAEPPAPGRNTMPASHSSSRIASRSALRKYFAIAVANRFGGSWP